MKIRALAVLLPILGTIMIGCGEVQFSGAPGMQKVDGLSSESDGTGTRDDDFGDTWDLPDSSAGNGVAEECAEAQAKEASTPASKGTVSIVNSFGALVIKANHIDRIEDSMGAVIVLGEGPNARIDLIDNHKGAMVLCNVSVGTIRDSWGAVGIYGDVTDVINHTGAMEVTGKVLGKVENHTGAFVNGK